MLGIRDILVRIRMLGFVPWYLWLMDPDPNPTPNPTHFFSDFKDVKKFFKYFFLSTGTSSLVLKI